MFCSTACLLKYHYVFLIIIRGCETHGCIKNGVVPCIGWPLPPDDPTMKRCLLFGAISLDKQPTFNSDWSDILHLLPSAFRRPGSFWQKCSRLFSLLLLEWNRPLYRLYPGIWLTAEYTLGCERKSWTNTPGTWSTEVADDWKNKREWMRKVW